MKIIVLTPLYPVSWDPTSGVFVHNFVFALRENGQEVKVVRITSIFQKLAGIVKRYSRKPDGPLFKDNDMVTTNHFCLPFLSYTKFRKYNQFFCHLILRGILNREKVDIQYCHFFESLHALRFSGVKGRAYLCLGESNLEYFAGVQDREEIRETLNRAEAIICVSQQNLTKLTSMFPALSSRIHHIPNGVDVRKFHPVYCVEHKSLLRDNLAPSFKHHFVSVGQFTERKGTQVLCKAMEILGNPEAGCSFIGSGPLPPAGNFVNYAGKIENDRIVDWYHSADIFVLPSLAEGMSNAILEAAACGLPLVVADSSFNREYIPEDSAVFVDPLDPEAIANALWGLLSDAELCLKLGQRSRKLAKEYSVKRRVERTLSLMRE